MKRLVFAALIAAAPALAQPTDAQKGKALYDQHCTACHGANAGAGDRAPAIVLGGVTNMRGQRSDAQIVAIIKNGIPGTGMPAWGTHLSAEELGTLGAYIHALRGTALDNPAPGDPAHGEAVFWGKGGCGGCHMVMGRGGVTGPDLSNIAAMRKSTAIADALTKAQHRVTGDGGVHLPMPPPMDDNPVHVVKKDGTVLDGVMRNQDAWSIQLMDLDGKLHSFDRASLRSVAIKPGSLMPTDYDKRLSHEEFADLLAFLTRQGARPGPPAGE
jgi:mono/diheme cytochrome c family protein